MTVRGVLGDSWMLYRRLLWRTVAIGAGVFVVLEIPGSLLGVVESRAAAAALAAAALVLSFVGSLLVQGALSNAVRDVHVGARERTVGGLCRDTSPRLGPLVAGSLLLILGSAARSSSPAPSRSPRSPSPAGSASRRSRFPS